MKRANLDSASPAVKKFIGSLALDTNGAEVILGGNIICKIIPPGHLSDAQRAAQLAEKRQLLVESRAQWRDRIEKAK